MADQMCESAIYFEIHVLSESLLFWVFKRVSKCHIVMWMQKGYNWHFWQIEVSVDIKNRGENAQISSTKAAKLYEKEFWA